MVARTSSRQAAQKAKEAISSSAEETTTGKPSAAFKRKATAENAPQPKKEQKIEQKPAPKKEEADGVDGIPETKPPEEKPRLSTIPGTHETVEEDVKPSKGPSAHGVESGVRKSEERENIVSSNILEKGIIYFFFRPRVNVEEPQSIGDVARSFIVLRPIPLGAELNGGQGPLDKDARCRLLMLPKKKFPTSGKERDMAFVEKAGQTMKELQDKFVSGSTYQTSTRGERTIEEARPYAEGVYAITSTYRSAHLVYVLTIPAELGEIQANFGLYNRGSWVVQSKNPQFPGPAIGQLPKNPEYPETVLEKFGGLRWVPLKPEFIEYPNAQILMIGEAQDHLGKAATAEGNKQANEEEPGQELEKLEHENEQRVEALQGDQTVYRDLGMYAKQLPSLPTSWNY